MKTGTREGLLKAIGNKGWIIGALSAGLLGTACGSMDDPLYDPTHCSQVPQEIHSDRILAIGDSVTAFWSEHHMNSCQAYSDYASKEINEHIQNSAIGGTELTGSYGKCVPQQYEDATAANGPYDVVILTAGANDLKNECPLAEHETCSVKCGNKLLEIADEMEALVTDIVNDGSDVVLVGYYNMKNSIYDKYNECLATSISAYKAIAASNPHVTFVHTEDMVNPNNASDYAVDGVHPSIATAQKIGRRVAEALR
jgi:lysophospholipase L1-like esterase